MVIVEYLRPCINNEESGNMSAALVTDERYSANMVKQLRALLNDEKKIVQSKRSRKRRIVDVTFPSNWTGNLHKTQRVLLDRRSNEFKKVNAIVLQNQAGKHGANINGTYVKGRIKVKNIYRIQSPKVWECYMMRKAAIAATNVNGPNEKWLFHGSTYIQTIIKHGLDPRVCSLNGMIGGGVYFASKSTKSARYSGCSRPGHSGSMFLCRVSLGREKGVDAI